MAPNGYAVFLNEDGTTTKLNWVELKKKENGKKYDYAYYKITNKTIKERAFIDNKKLLSIVIPDGVELIDEQAFSACSRLSSVQIPDSVTKIFNHAFKYCVALWNIKIPSSTEYVGFWAFKDVVHVYYDGKLSTEEWKVGYINGYLEDDYLYADKTKRTLLKYVGADFIVSIPDEVLKIEDNAFAWHRTISKVVVPDGVVSIGKMAFQNSTLLYIAMSDSVAEIGEECFENCHELEEVILPSKITIIAKQTFSGCWSLAKITLPDGLEIIGSEAFEWCQSLASITIPKTVQEIHSFAFNMCVNLKTLIMSDSCRDVSQLAFNTNIITDFHYLEEFE